MILVTGGMAQGKRAFVERELLAGEAEGRKKEHKAEWTDGAEASWEEAAAARYLFNFHRLVRRIIAGEASAMPSDSCEVLTASEDAPASFSPVDLARLLFRARPDRIVVTDEVGCGIVPVDKGERDYREAAGRICCGLAACSDQVWRVSCGLGMRIK